MSVADSGYADRLMNHDLRTSLQRASEIASNVTVPWPDSSRSAEEKIADEIDRLSDLHIETLQHIISAEAVEVKAKAEYDLAIAAVVTAKQDEIQCLDELTRALKQKNQM